MTASDYLALAALLISIAGLIYREGQARERQRQLELKTKEWADGLGRLARDIRSKDERRWKHNLAVDIIIIAVAIEQTEILAEARMHAKQIIAKVGILKEDAWRD